MARIFSRRAMIGGAAALVGAAGLGVGARSRAQDASPAAGTPATPVASPIASPMASPSAATAITITGFDIGWEYEGQRTAPGAPITVPVSPGTTINLPNQGVAAHNFVVDEWAILLDMPIGGTTQATVPADAAPGSYKFYCNIAGHEPAGMVGTLVVD